MQSSFEKVSTQRTACACVDKMQVPKFYLRMIWDIQYLIYNIESTVKRYY